MINLCHDVHTNAQQKELRESERADLDLAAYEGTIRPEPFGEIAIHWHEEWELFWLVQGCVRIEVGTEECVLQEGEALFINAGALHGFVCNEGRECRYRSFVFGSELIGGMPGSVFDRRYVQPVEKSGIPYMRFTLAKSPAFFEHFDKAFAACKEDLPGYELTARDALGQIALMLLENCTALARHMASGREERLKTMLQWAEENVEKEFCVQELAAAANICVRECQRIFMQYLHKRPMEHIREQRIHHAAVLLRETHKPITEIAMQCGFSGSSYFASQFKALVGQTPGQYRRQHSIE